MRAGILGAFRLGEDAAVEFKDLIGAQHHRIAGITHPPRLGFGKRVGNVARPRTLGLQRGADGFLVDTHRTNRDMKTRLGQQARADLGGRGEDEIGLRTDHVEGAVEKPGCNTVGNEGAETGGPRSPPAGASCQARQGYPAYVGSDSGVLWTVGTSANDLETIHIIEDR